MSEPFKSQVLSGWGRMSPCECQVYRPERQRDLKAVLESLEDATVIPRGLGRSYGDTAVNEGGGVIDMARLNRMLSFDEETGILECEAGVGLEEIINVFLPRGFFLPVTPGTKFVTLGGAIANDVHGKNHHAVGTISEFVTEFELLTASGESLTCTREENSEVFWATVGGIGLTGILLSAKIRLQRVESAYVSVDYRRCAHLDESLETMAAQDSAYPYSVAWVDCLARGGSLGRSVLMHGRHAAPDQLPPQQRSEPFRAPKARPLTVPVDFPGFALNPLSIGTFNAVFYRRHGDAQGVIIDFDKYFYPLDRILQWNRMYGKRGFVQYQASFPREGVAGLKAMLERLSASKRASFLAVLKCLGPEGPGMLSHPIEGFTLNLDIPNHGELIPFLHELDRILLDHGGRLYLAKDAAAAPETVAEMYPKLGEFREVLGRLDPEGRFSSTMARRLGISAGGQGE